MTLSHLSTLLAAASPLPWEAELDSFTEEEGIVATFANRGELLGKIETGIMLHKSDGPDWTAADSAARDAVWARARAGQEIKDADLIVALVNAAPQLLAIAHAAQAVVDMYERGRQRAIGRGADPCYMPDPPEIDALKTALQEAG